MGEFLIESDVRGVLRSWKVFKVFSILHWLSNNIVGEFQNQSDVSMIVDCKYKILNQLLKSKCFESKGLCQKPQELPILALWGTLIMHLWVQLLIFSCLTFQCLTMKSWNGCIFCWTLFAKELLYLVLLIQKHLI